jgi:hypothetical protein
MRGLVLLPAAFLFVLAIAVPRPSPLHAQSTPAQPWLEPQDSAAAINDPDQYAWRLFVALNWPASAKAGIADSTKPLGSDGPVVWESWKNARDTFLSGGADPGPWDASPKPALRSIREFDAQPLQLQLRDAAMGKIKPMFAPDAALSGGNETRLNRATYEFITGNDLYNLDGQKALAKRGDLTISFPLDAKEIKAQWRPITAADKARYHWAEIKLNDGTTAIFGLTALHIISKDLPNWFWATFEHVDNPTRPGNAAWVLPSHDTFACKGQQPDCNKAPTGIGLEGTVWANYRLRGTQVDFTTSRGVTTLLANSQPEGPFQTTSSCITCHARSTVSAAGKALDFFKPNGDGFVGPVDAAWFKAPDGTSRYLQRDFVWSLMRAQPKDKK